MMSLGYLTFGGATAGFVSTTMPTVTCLLPRSIRHRLGPPDRYPFTFCAMRDGILDITKATPEKRAAVTKPLNVALITAVTILAILLKDVGFVVPVRSPVRPTLMFMVPS